MQEQFDKKTKIYLIIIAGVAVLGFAVYFILMATIPKNPPALPAQPEKETQKAREDLLKNLVAPASPLNTSTTTEKARVDVLKNLVAPAKPK